MFILDISRKNYKLQYSLFFMKNRGILAVFVVALLLFFSISYISASVEDEFKKLANYAQEYETGNINYVQLLTYSSAIRENMNGILGSTQKNMGGIVKEDQIKSILGEPIQTTRWVWDEGEQREKKIAQEVPVWKKIIYDGKKIQIRLNAWPSIFSKKKISESEITAENKNEIDNLEGKIVYRLNFEVSFKKPAEQIDIQGRINEIESLAKSYIANPSSEGAEQLAKEAVTAEKSFWSYFEQIGQKCEDIMNGIFGSESKKRQQNMLVQEYTFCEGDNFEVIARLEICENCEWSWIGLNFNVEGRGPGFKINEEKKDQIISIDSLKSMSLSELETQMTNKIQEIKQSCENKDFKTLVSKTNEIWPINDALNQKSNDVWKELDKTYNAKMEAMSPEERQKFDQSYGWIKLEQEKRQEQRNMAKANSESLRNFYTSLFAGLDKRETFYTQIEYEKRLVEIFKEGGKETCNNNADDNDDGNIDCLDDQCGGKLCGKGNVQEGNETREVDYYCIEKTCKPKDETVEVVIEKNETFTCNELPAIECAEGSKAYFSKYDSQTNCPLETSCFKEDETCEIAEDCTQPACGKAECIENKCQVTQLTECKEIECLAGEEKICEKDNSVVALCIEGFWKETGECTETPEVKEEEVVGNQCTSASDCGKDGVCNNGVCQIIPQVVEETQDEKDNQENEKNTEEDKNNNEEIKQEENTQQVQENNNEQTPQEDNPVSEITDKVAMFFLSITGKITGFSITGFDVQEQISEVQEEPAAQEQNPGEEQVQENNNEQTPQEDNPNNPDNPAVVPNQENNNEQTPPADNQNDEEERRQEENERRQEEDKRRIEESKERCTKDCARPCIEKCIRESCGEELNCVVEEMQKKCESTCVAEDGCVEKCMKGENWWEDYNNKEDKKQEREVFQAGGSCRTSNGKTEAGIWFGGWGENFEKIQYLKNKYYSGGQADWCKYDYENLKTQRQEFEKGFNQEYAQWFFEKYLANSAEDWESAVSGIYELYWKDVDNSRELAFRMQCLGIEESPEVNLINFKYESEYGSLEFWEEIKTVRLEGLDKEVQIVSPYMKVWVFPTKEFLIYEMKKAMQNHEFPGSPEEKAERENEEGLKAEEKEAIKQNDRFMKKLKAITDKYGGSFDVNVQLKDSSTNDTVFNLYVQLNEEDILKFKPMLPEEVPSKDANVEIDFDRVYNLIYTEQKEMAGQRTEMPPWDKKTSPIQTFNEIKNGIKMFFEIRGLINSAKITPAESEKDIRKIINSFISMMLSSENKGDQSQDPEKKNEQEKKQGQENSEVDKDKNMITGKVLFG
jgi:hypothetical protein